MHGGEPPEGEDDTVDLPFTHKPCHDVESIYWTLLYSLVKAHPAGAPVEVSFPGVHLANQLVFQHTIPSHSNQPGEGEEFTRSLFLSTPPYPVEQALHPTLRNHGLGMLLYQLAAQVLPEYTHLHPQPPADHLHEAFRRILLDFIVTLDTDPSRDVALDPDVSRQIMMRPNEEGSQSLGKRTREDSSSIVLTPSKKSRLQYAPETEVNGSHVICESFR